MIEELQNKTDLKGTSARFDAFTATHGTRLTRSACGCVYSHSLLSTTGAKASDMVTRKRAKLSGKEDKPKKKANSKKHAESRRRAPRQREAERGASDRRVLLSSVGLALQSKAAGPWL